MLVAPKASVVVCAESKSIATTAVARENRVRLFLVIMR